jgi:hypothetical protein
MLTSEDISMTVKADASGDQFIGLEEALLVLRRVAD